MADKNKAMERVKALIARTASDSEEEARTCALLACRLIREHALEVVDPAAPAHNFRTVRAAPSRKNPPPPQQGESVHSSFVDDMSAFEDLLRTMGVDVSSFYGPPKKPWERKDWADIRGSATNVAGKPRADNTKTKNYARQEQQHVRGYQQRKVKEEKERQQKAKTKKCPGSQPNSGPRYRKKDIYWKARPADMDYRCEGCQREFRKGEPIVWASGFGTYRAACLEKIDDNFEFVPYHPDLVDPETKQVDKKESGKTASKTQGVFVKYKVWTKQYKSSHNGTCALCDKTYRKGDNIRWVRGFGSFHPDCWDKLPDDAVIVPNDLLKACTAVKNEYKDAGWQRLYDKACEFEREYSRYEVLDPNMDF